MDFRGVFLETRGGGGHTKRKWSKYVTPYEDNRFLRRLQMSQYTSRENQLWKKNVRMGVISYHTGVTSYHTGVVSIQTVALLIGDIYIDGCDILSHGSTLFFSFFI